MSDNSGGALANRARAAYSQHAALTASPEALTAMLFAGAASRLERAETAARKGDRKETLRLLSSAGAIVAELRGSLDFERGGAVADDLFRLYGFVQDRLRRAATEQGPEPVAEARMVIAKLKEGWDQLVAGV